MRPLFDARWLWRDARPAPEVEAAGWRKIEDGLSLAAWERAWRGGVESPDPIFRPELLNDPAVSVLGCAAQAAGGIAYDAVGVLGVTNIFGSRRRFLGALGTIGPPDKPVVAYEAGDDLASAQANGFQRLGALRVWTRR